MIDIKVYREYWEGVQKRIPEIKEGATRYH